MTSQSSASSFRWEKPLHMQSRVKLTHLHICRYPQPIPPHPSLHKLICKFCIPIPTPVTYIGKSLRNILFDLVSCRLIIFFESLCGFLLNLTLTIQQIQEWVIESDISCSVISVTLIIPSVRSGIKRLILSIVSCSGSVLINSKIWRFTVITLSSILVIPIKLGPSIWIILTHSRHVPIRSMVSSITTSQIVKHGLMSVGGNWSFDFGDVILDSNQQKSFAQPSLYELGNPVLLFVFPFHVYSSTLYSLFLFSSFIQQLIVCFSLRFLSELGLSLGLCCSCISCLFWPGILISFCLSLGGSHIYEFHWCFMKMLDIIITPATLILSKLILCLSSCHLHFL